MMGRGAVSPVRVRRRCVPPWTSRTSPCAAPQRNPLAADAAARPSRFGPTRPGSPCLKSCPGVRARWPGSNGDRGRVQH
eukprot:501936-Alexandrium_andersonii.AAC.1